MSDISFDSDNDGDHDETFNVKSVGERRRSSARSGGRKVNYGEDDDDDEDYDDKDDDDDDESDDGNDYNDNMKVDTMSVFLDDGDDDENDNYDRKLAAVPTTTGSSKSCRVGIDPSPKKKKIALPKGDDDDEDMNPDAANNNNNYDGIDIVIPHSLLDKSRGAGKNECMLLVQIASEPSSTTSTKTSTVGGGQQHRPLDFHGQSGAIGRFEADGDGGTFCLLS